MVFQRYIFYYKFTAIMGNAHENGISPTLKEFEIVRTHPLDYYKQIKHKKTGQTLLVKQIVPMDESDSNNIQNIIESKMHYKSTFVTQLVYWEKPVSTQFCSKSQSYLLLFNNVGITLAEYIKSIRRAKLSFQVDKLTNILQEVLKGLKYFNTVHHLHKQISPDCIFYDGYRAILMDPWLTSKHSVSAEAMKLHREVRKNVYKSPQKQLYQRDEIQSYDFLKSNVYELGLLIMDLATDGKYTEQFDQIYDKRCSVSKQKIRKVNIGVLLESIQDFQLKSKLNVLLNPNPDKRLTIFNIMLPQRITLKEFNPVNKNTNFKNLPHNRFNSQFTQNSTKKWPKSLKKVREGQKNTTSKSKDMALNLNSLKILSTNNHTPEKSQIYKYESLANSPRTDQISLKIQKQRNRSVSSTPRGSIFTYAQWLPNYTQSNQTAFLSKKQQKQTHPNSFYHHPHKILKNIQSHKTSPNNSFVRQAQQSSRNYNQSYQDHLSPKQSFINQLHYTSRNNEENLNTIEEQMNSYITSGVKVESIPLSRQNSNIKLSENQSNKNLIPSRTNNFNRNNNNRCHFQASPQIRKDSKQNINVRFHISNPSPQKSVYNQPHYINTLYSLQPPKLSPGINFISTPEQNYHTKANILSHPTPTNAQKNDQNIKQKQLNSTVNKIVLQKKQSKQSKSSKSSQSSPSTPSFHRRLFPQSKEQQKVNFNKNIEGKKIIQEIKMGDIGMVKKTKTIESMEEESQQEYQIKQVQQEYESSRIYQRKPTQQQLEKQKIQIEKEKEKQNEKQQGKEKDKSRQSSKASKSSSKNRLSYIKISTPDKKKSIQEYSVNFTQSNEEDSGEDRDKDKRVTSNRFHRSEKDKQCRKQQKGNLRNQYTSDLDSAKEAQSIIFESESKTNLKKQFSKIRKKDHHSLQNSLDQDSFNKNISFGPVESPATKQKNMNKQVKDKIIKKTDIRPTQQSDFIKKIISMTNSKIHEKGPQQLSLFEANTAKKSENKKPTLYNAGGKLTLSIQTSPLASIESVVDNNYGSSLFGNLKKREKSNNSSPYLKNLKKENRQDYGKIQQQLQSAVIGEQLGYSQLGYSQQYDIIGLNKKFSSKNKEFKRVQDKSDVIEQHLKTENTLINQLEELRSVKLQSNQYNSQSNKSLKYYVIEKYPLSSNNQLIEKYQGYKSNGLRHGFGTYYYANGDIYHGEWVNDKHHGQGGIYRRRKRENSLNIDQMSLLTKNIIHNKQQYEIVCQGIWENGQFVPNIDTNSNNSNKNSSNPVSPPSSPNVFSKSSPDKYKTSLVNLLPIPSKICSSFQVLLHPTQKSLGEEISFVTSQNFQSDSCCSIGKKQKIPEFSPLTQIITLKNGDLFKGKSISNKGTDNQMTINGKLIKKNGQIVEGTWLYKTNQLFEIK